MKLASVLTNSSITANWIGEHRTGPWPRKLESVFPEEIVRNAQEDIVSWDGYEPTPLRSLAAVAALAGVRRVLYKDESGRFGLGSFKALGGAYAVLNHIAETLSSNSCMPVTVAEVRSGAYADAALAITVATATDGNHGRSVAWGASLAGCACKIFVHAGVSKSRVAAMSSLGADVVRIDGDYDASVRAAADLATQHGWDVISDTSYEGYTELPRQGMAGYTVLVRELLDQLEGPPTHVILQAGVGGLAAAIGAAQWMAYGDDRPRQIVVESDKAACVMRSMQRGRASAVDVVEETLMAGLSCGEMSPLAFEVLSLSACSAVTISDAAVPTAMRYLAGEGIEAGECAVPGIIALLAVSKDSSLADALAIDEHSVVLVLGCEGATDPELYARVLAGEG